MNYEEMLKLGREKLPEETTGGDRFTIPKVKGHLQGNKTVISNITQIVSILRRPIELVAKYIEKFLATKSVIEGNFIIFNTKLSSEKINERIQMFADEFVICKECGKPDTQLGKNAGVYVLTCSACGAKYSVKTKL
ncbi:MAG: translation initiation factor IF-2 subunit beta [Candidatus Nanoarchaeia archaeon]|nr:translation initiation factor IF-2 subunit beta [Candidatus Nanoarchaeia archaeon]